MAAPVLKQLVMGGADGHFMVLEIDPPTRRFLNISFHYYDGPPLPPWVSPELLAETRRTWSLHFHRVVSIQESLEALRRIRELTGTLYRSLQVRSTTE